ncbi:MAG TPA: hypothetical protein VD905_03135 [Flavobacteriales bacterium]|nr:hypothetical protein [Flavobacteriales bacterium]
MFNPKKQLKMKKLALLATVFAALTFTSCGNGKEEGENGDTTAVAEDTATSTEPAVEEPTVDTTMADTAAAE